jgi:riboflavin kinase/FMN adenylyltransferase
MRLFRHYTDLPADAHGAVVALGNFDGVHCGHRVVIGKAAEIARSLGAPLAVLTFEPHPRSLFRPNDPPFRLTPFRIKARHIEELGVDLLFVIHFDTEFSHMTALSFIDDVLVGGLKARHIVAGYDFVFGYRRGGDIGMLYGMAPTRGFGVTEVKPASDTGGAVFSSTRVRDLLIAGKPRQAAEVLGRPWEIEGRVEHGDQRGRTIGFPTANLELGEYQRPAYGVYAVRAGIDHGLRVAGSPSLRFRRHPLWPASARADHRISAARTEIRRLRGLEAADRSRRPTGAAGVDGGVRLMPSRRNRPPGIDRRPRYSTLADFSSPVIALKSDFRIRMLVPFVRSTTCEI